MPLPREIKPNLNKFVSATVGTAQAIIITRVQNEVNRIIDELSSQCPPPDVLASMSKTVNTLRPILTSADKKIKTAGNIAKFIDPLILAANIIIEIVINLPIPSGFEPIGVQTRRIARIMWLYNLIEVLSDEGEAVKQVVQGASDTLTPLKVKLDQVDALLQACIANQNLSDEDRSRILKSIQGEYSDPSLNSLEYTSTSGYNYTIKVIVDPNSPEIAPKRQAIAQDFRGITVLTGPSSFASDPQVLIEEIKFRIENQLP